MEARNLFIVSSNITISVLNLGKLWTKHDLEQKAMPLPENKRDEILLSVIILLVSANVSETLATFSCLQPLDGHGNILKFHQEREHVTYYIGKYGACKAAIGVTSDDFEVDGSARTISTLANQCFPNLCATISVGVACGVKGKVQLCDVLVSSQVVNYDKIPDDQMYLPSEELFIVSPWLKKLFFQPVHWPDYAIKERLFNNDMPMPNVVSGVIFSGPKYNVDDPAMNDFVRKFAGEAIGIEMQRAHYFKTNTVNAIIVKAVCDFGNGKNNEKYQPIAALLAANLVQVCLSDHQASEELKGLHNVAIV